MLKKFDFRPKLAYCIYMTVKELQEKIEVLSNAIKFPALPNDNATLQVILKDILLELQGDLIKKLDNASLYSNSMTDEEREDALNNIG